LLSVFQLTSFYKKLDTSIISKYRLQLDCYSAAQKCISSFDSLPSTGTFLVNNSSVCFQKKSFGLFQYLITSAKINHDSVKAEYLIGNSLSAIFENAIIFSTPNFRASVSGNTKITGDILASSNKIKTEIIKLKPISEIIDLIRNDFPGKKLVLKIDCEGSEYEILQSLYESDSLKYVVIIMLEWHRRSILHDPSGIVDILINSGFNVRMSNVRAKSNGRDVRIDDVWFVAKYIKEIGSHNQKHLDKIKK